MGHELQTTFDVEIMNPFSVKIMLTREVFVEFAQGFKCARTMVPDLCSLVV